MSPLSHTFIKLAARHSHLFKQKTLRFIDDPTPASSLAMPRMQKHTIYGTRPMGPSSIPSISRSLSILMNSLSIFYLKLPSLWIQMLPLAGMHHPLPPCFTFQYIRFLFLFGQKMSKYHAPFFLFYWQKLSFYNTTYYFTFFHFS